MIIKDEGLITVKKLTFRSTEKQIEDEQLKV